MFLKLFQCSYKILKSKFIAIVLILFYNCSFNVVSPGITTLEKLVKKGENDFRTLAYYGNSDYEIEAYYLNKEIIEIVLNDPNNIYYDKLNFTNFSEKIEKDIPILVEWCFDTSKTNIAFEDEIGKFSIKLNNNPSVYRLSYYYLYSYNKYGSRKKKHTPLIVREDHPFPNNLVLTSENFLGCIRSLNFFVIDSERRGKNELTIALPTEAVVTFEYQFDGEYIKNWNNDIEFGYK